MYQQLDVTGRAVKVGALTITGTFAGEMEPVDRVSEEETPGVWCADGSVFFEYRGREYSQDFPPRGSTMERLTIGTTTLR